MNNAPFTRIAQGGLWSADCLLFDELPSTNQWLLDHAATCRHGDVVLARHQSAGRGRFDRTWSSPGTENLTLSVLINPNQLDRNEPHVLTRLAALSVTNLLECHGVPCRIKWPNDVLARDKKIAGILAEQDTDTSCIVLGIGVNLNLDPLTLSASDLAAPATSLSSESGCSIPPETLCPLLLTHLASVTDAYQQAGEPWLSATWKTRDALLNRSVVVATASGSIEGLYAGTDAQGRLCLVTTNGKTHSFSAGEVSVRPL